MTDDLARQLVENCGALLLDFDGPMTALLPYPRNAELARASMEPLKSAGVVLPPDLEQTTDHLKVLRWVAANAPNHIAAVENIAIAGEVEAAHTSPITESLPELLNRYAHKLVVVTNNAPEAPQALLSRLGDPYGALPICGRPRRHPELMKPSPHLVLLGATRAGRRPDECVMVGDHASDVSAAHAAGATTIGFAKTPRHRGELDAADADVIIAAWAEILT